MTQKKAPVDTVDRLIESGNGPAIISRYVELTLEANKLKQYLLANPDIAQALLGLLPQSTPLSPPLWDSVARGNTPQATMQLLQNSLGSNEVEPLGTIHKDVPTTYEYPMDEYTQAASQSQDVVISMLQTYQGIDPTGEVV